MKVPDYFPQELIEHAANTQGKTFMAIAIGFLERHGDEKVDIVMSVSHVNCPTCDAVKHVVVGSLEGDFYGPMCEDEKRALGCALKLCADRYLESRGIAFGDQHTD